MVIVVLAYTHDIRVAVVVKFDTFAISEHAKQRAGIPAGGAFQLAIVTGEAIGTSAVNDAALFAVLFRFAYGQNNGE